MSTTPVRVPTPEDITPAYLSSAIGVPVTDATITRIIWGSATKVLMRVTYGEPTDLPTDICVKGLFDERLLGLGVEEGYAIETAFYTDVAPDLSIPLPRVVGSTGDVVILEDLDAAGASFGDPVEPWDVDRVAAALTVQATWHRETWAAADGPVAALTVGATAVRGAARVFHSAEHWGPATAPGGFAIDIPAGLDDPARMMTAFERLWERDAAGPVSLAHGDAHVGNTYTSAAGQPSFVDWQGACRAPGFYDVAYFLIGALTIEDRRRAERDLVAHYTDALASHGGPRLAADDAWADYRRYALHGFLWVMTPPVMQTIERVHAMSHRYVAAIQDLETLDLLDV